MGAADEEIRGLEYSSDRQHVLRTSDELSVEDSVSIDGTQDSVEEAPTDKAKCAFEKVEEGPDPIQKISDPQETRLGHHADGKGKRKAVATKDGVGPEYAESSDRDGVSRSAV